MEIVEVELKAGTAISKAEIKALQGLQKGDLTALAEFLWQGNGTMHRTLQLKLAAMIDGPGELSDHRLKVIRHPDLKPGQSSSEIGEQQRKEISTAFSMARNGGFVRGHYEAALAQTVKDTGLSRATVARHWKGQKEYIDWVECTFKEGLIPRKPEDLRR